MAPNLHFVLKRWPLFALIACAMMLAIAHAFQTFGHLAPCHLCLKQREVFWGGMIAAAAVIAFERLVPDWKGPSPRIILGVIFLASAALAAFHAGVEWHWWKGPADCTAGGVGRVSLDDMKSIANNTAVIKPPMCDKAAWIFLGISMAGWNALISLGLTAVSVLAVLRPGDDKA